MAAVFIVSIDKIVRKFGLEVIYMPPSAGSSGGAVQRLRGISN